MPFCTSLKIEIKLFQTWLVNLGEVSKRCEGFGDGAIDGRTSEQQMFHLFSDWRTRSGSIISEGCSQTAADSSILSMYVGVAGFYAAVSQLYGSASGLGSLCPLPS